MSTQYPSERHTRTYTGLEFIEGFALFAGALWVAGAVLVGSLVLLSNQRPQSAAANQTPVAESNNTPTTEPVQTVDESGGPASPGETPATP